MAVVPWSAPDVDPFMYGRIREIVSSDGDDDDMGEVSSDSAVVQFPDDSSEEGDIVPVEDLDDQPCTSSSILQIQSDGPSETSLSSSETSEMDTMDID